MKRMHIGAMLGGWLMCALVGGAWAAETPGDNDRAAVRDPLAAKEQLVRDRMTQLEDRMFRLSEKLASTEPQQARRLESALRQARELLIRRNMEEVMTLLEQGRITEASDRQGQVQGDLERLLKTLMEEPDNREERKKREEELKKYREEVRQLLEKERELKSLSDAAPRLEQLQAALRAAIARLEALIARQEAVQKTSAAEEAKDPTTGTQLTEKQKQLRLEAESLSQNLNQPLGPSSQPSAAPPTPGEAKPASSNPPGAPGAKSSESAGKPAESQPASANNQPPDEKPDAHEDHEGHDHEKAEAPKEPAAGEKPSASQPSAPEAPIEAGMRRAGSGVEKAAGQMKSAESSLQKRQPQAAVPEQKAAVDSLKKALSELKAQEQDATRKLNQLEAAKKQREVRELAQKLAQNMEGKNPQPPNAGDQKPGENKPGDGQSSPKPPGSGSQSGSKNQGGESKPGEGKKSESQQGGENGQKNQPKEQAPGAENVKKASEHMEDAEKDLEKQNTPKAAENQQKSIDELEKAQQELEQTLEQLRREQQEEILRGLQGRFQAMLAQQELINKGTDELDKKGVKTWTHADELSVASLSKEELKLHDEAGQALNILKEDGTSIVFPRIVEQMQGDMKEAGRLLAQKQTAEPTPTVQAAIITALKDLIEAIKQKREELQQGGGGGGGGGGGDKPEPLLPDSAELKLLKSCQERINRQTSEYEKAHGNAPTADPALRQHLSRIADRQKEVADMARKMNERATGQ